MKKVILLVCVSIGVLSCKNDADVVPKNPKSDTSLTLAMYLGYGLKGIEYGPARKIIIDTLTWVDRDSTTRKKEWTKMTFYDVEVSIPVKDSLTARMFGVKSTDTVIRRILKSESKYVVDGVTNWDSTLKYLNQFRDTTQPKKDTTKR